jgi:hypothetical protein
LLRKHVYTLDKLLIHIFIRCVHVYLFYMVEHRIMLTFKLTVVEICNLEYIYIAYFIDIELFFLDSLF